jgi:hypothetical protein
VSFRRGRERVGAQLTRGDLVHLLHIGSNAHLLGKLRRLGKVGVTCSEVERVSPATSFRRRTAKLTLEVRDLEDGGARLGGSSLKLGGVDLGESLRVEVLAEEVADARGHLEDGLVGNGLLVEGRQRSFWARVERQRTRRSRIRLSRRVSRATVAPSCILRARVSAELRSLERLNSQPSRRDGEHQPWRREEGWEPRR